MKVICISAKAQHGKDTSALILKEIYEAKGNKVLITHFADLVKYICKQYFNWDGNKDEKGRTLLQYIGTDVIGAKNPTYWADFIVNFLKMFEYEWDYVIIPDCRYPIEAATMESAFDTTILRIERPNFDNGLTNAQKNHPSEVAMDHFTFDTVIYNKGSFDELKAELLKFTLKEEDKENG
jgi:hypothetical protein